MSQYPALLDNDADLPPVIDNITEIGGEAINALRDSVFALQSAIGIDPQGTQQDLSTRLSRTLNSDGTWKAAQLAAAGLISLPITNSQVGASAAIEESKLDLNISTQSLQDQITSNDVDITALQDSLAADINNLAQHIVGNYGRHDGYQIDISGLTAQPTITTVEDALGFIYDTFLRHRKSTTEGEHVAAAISYIPVPGGPITATNVQDAIEQRDAQITEAFRLHRDAAHANGVSEDGYVYLGGQAAVNSASLRLARFISSVGSDVVKLGLVNSAVVVGSGFEPADFSATSDAITITAKNGTSSRSITVTGLNSSSADYPSAASPRFKLKGVVNALNTEFGNATNNFPVTAFEADGELALQHNIARDDCSITLTAPANSALPALGLASLAGTEVNRVNNYVYNINGKEYTELNTLLSGSVTHGGGATVNFGTTISNPSKFKFLHVFDHPTANQNGTYKIVSVGATAVNLVASISAGTFNYIVYEDGFDLPSATNPVTLDFFIDENRALIADNRIEAAPGPTGIKIMEASRGLTGSSASLELASTSLQLTVDGVAGTAVTFDNQFVGYVEVPAPDGIEFVIVFIFNAGASIGTSVLTLSDSEFQDNRLHLGTAHFDLGSTIENPLDRRNAGLVGNQSIASEFKKDFLERDVSNLHISGVVSGLSIITTSFPASSITLEGGSAYVNGRLIQKPRVTIEAGNRISGASTYNLLLSYDGTYEILDNTLAGYGVDDIIAGDDYILIAQLVGSGGSITSVTDGRAFVNDVELKLQLTVDDRNLGAGIFRTLEAAQLYSRNAPNDTKPEISVYSDITLSQALTIDSATHVRALQDVTSTGGAITVSSDSTLEVLGNLVSDSTITVSGGGTLILRGSSNSITAATSISLGANATLIVDGYTSLQQISVTANNVQIYSTDLSRNTISFTANSTGIDVAAGRIDLRLENLDMIMSKTGQNSILSFQGITGLDINNCSFSLDTPTITTTQATQTARAGIEFTTGTAADLRIRDCEFTNIAAGIISITPAVLSKVMISGCRFTDVGRAVEIHNSSEVYYDNNLIERMHQFGILFVTGASLTEDIVISNSTFRDLFDGASTPVPISGATTIYSIHILNNIFRDITTTDIIDLSGEFLILGNSIRDCTVTGAVFDLVGSAQTPNTGGTSPPEPALVANNKAEAIDGNIIIATDVGFATNSFEAITSGTSGVSLTCSSHEVKFANNSVVLENDSNFSLTAGGDGFNFTGNYIYADKMELSSPAIATSIFSNNQFEFTNAATLSADGLDIIIGNSSNSSRIIIDANYIVGSEGDTIRIDPNGATNFPRTTISNNVIVGGTTSGVHIGEGAGGSVDSAYLINNNVIDGNGSYGVLVDGYNCSVTGNHIVGSIAVADVSIVSGIASTFVSNNFSSSSGVGAGIMATQSSNQLGVYIGQNKNVIEPIVFDAFSGYPEDAGSWDITALKVESNTASSRLFYIPLTGLPQGAVLDSVDMHCRPNGVAGTTNIRLYNRESTSLTATNIGPPTGVDNANNGTREVMTISPSSEANSQIRPDRLFFIEITSTASQNQIAQVVANVKY